MLHIAVAAVLQLAGLKEDRLFRLPAELVS